jgi:hypothetical protein
MKRLPSVLALALLLAVRPTAQQHAPSITATVTLVQHVDVFQTASQAYTLSHTPAAGMEYGMAVFQEVRTLTASEVKRALMFRGAVETFLKAAANEPIQGDPQE